jgi:hypothetical protein
MDWTVFSGIDKNLSSRKSKFHEVREALPFVQAILDINELYARRLAALQPGELPRGEGKTWAEARKKLETHLDELYQMELVYVKQETEALQTATDRGQNRKKVRELSEKIKRRLAETLPPNRTPPTATTSPSVQPSTPPSVRPSASP